MNIPDGKIATGVSMMKVA
jgi:hypothetical protein